MRQAYDYWQDQPGSNPSRHPAPPVPAGAEQARPSIRRSKRLPGLAGASAPPPRHPLGPRARHLLMSHTTNEGSGATRGMPCSPPGPLTRHRMETPSRGINFHQKDRQHKNQMPLLRERRGQHMTRTACRRFNGRAQSPSTGTVRSPLARHHVRVDRQHRTNHAPQDLSASEQVEGARDINPAPLGMNTTWASPPTQQRHRSGACLDTRARATCQRAKCQVLSAKCVCVCVCVRASRARG